MSITPSPTKHNRKNSSPKRFDLAAAFNGKVYQEKLKELVEVRKLNEEQRSRISKLEQQIIDNNDLNESKNSQFKLLVRQSMIPLLKENYTHIRREKRQKIIREGQSVGRIVPIQQGHTVKDYWEDGELIIENRRKISHSKEMEKILHKRTASVAIISYDNETTDNMPTPAPPKSITPEDAAIFKFKQENLKKELREAVLESKHLEIRKQIQIRNQRRMNDEEMSKFNNFPLLGKQSVSSSGINNYGPSYLLLELLGRGGFAEVYMAYDLDHFRYVVCKIHEVNLSWKDDEKGKYIQRSVREYEIQQSLKHPRIVQLYDVFAIDSDKKNSFCTVMEYCDSEDLENYIKLKAPLSEKESVSIITQVVSGLKYLHETTSSTKKSIIHYDLKPANILFHRGAVKLTDFGLSKIIDNPNNSLGIEQTSMGAGTYWYLPPECFKNENLTCKVDIWSVGVIFYQMLYNVRPFGHDQSAETIVQDRLISNASGVIFPSKPLISDWAKNFLTICLKNNVSERADISQLSKLCDQYYVPIKKEKE